MTSEETISYLVGGKRITVNRKDMGKYMIQFGTVFGHWKLVGRSNRKSKGGRTLYLIQCLRCGVYKDEKNNGMLQFIRGKRDPDKVLACQCTRPNYTVDKPDKKAAADG